MSNSQGKSSGGGNGPFILVLVLLGIGLVFLSTVKRRDATGMGGEARYMGLPLPPLNVEGWLNTGGPLRDESLRGQVVLVDCWFVDCPPCRAEMPHLAEFYARHRNSGLVVIGLTPDSGEDAGRAKAFLESVPGAVWPVGTGAQMPLDMLGVREFPTLILFNRQGVSVWAGHSTAGLDEVVAKVMAEGSS